MSGSLFWRDQIQKSALSKRQCLAELPTPPRSRSYWPLASVIVGRWVDAFVTVFPCSDTECFKKWKEFFFSKLEMPVPSEEHPASCGCFNLAASVWGLCEELMMAWNPLCEPKSSCKLTWEITFESLCVRFCLFILKHQQLLPWKGLFYFLSGKAYQDLGFVSCLLFYSITALFFLPQFYSGATVSETAFCRRLTAFLN